jgi:hypothetical protein
MDARVFLALFSIIGLALLVAYIIVAKWRDL